MSEWQDMQNNSSGYLRKLLQERVEKANPRRKLAKDEATKLAKLEAIVEKLKGGENVQNRQLQTWLSENQYAELEQAWEEQLELREELKDKPDDLKRYEEKLKQASFYYNRAEGYSRKGKNTTSKTFCNKSESLCEDALEILQEILHYDSSLRIWFDSDKHGSCSQDKVSHGATTAADSAKRHRTNRRYAHSSTATVTKLTKPVSYYFRSQKNVLFEFCKKHYNAYNENKMQKSCIRK